MLLAGDVGGTKTQLAVISPGHGPRRALAEARFRSAEFPSLEAMVQQFLRDVDQPIEHAVFGVAGPVVGGTAKITNLPWHMDERHLSSELDIQSVRLLNDLEAIAFGLPHLESRDLSTLNTGKPVQNGAMAVIAPGTGLGEAFLTYEEGQPHVHPSEGGHCDFAPQDEIQIGMLRYLQQRDEGHVSYERVCSGIGIPNIYHYLRDSDFAPEPEAFRLQLDGLDDPTPAIVQAGVEDGAGQELCRKTLEVFSAILAAEAGNLALKVLAVGGVYLAGGLPPRILSLLQDGAFMDSFRHKGRFEELLRDIPVHVVLHPEIALLGSGFYGLQMM